ncbi:hypothetical protein [Clostridium sp. ZS2-4]|uniref:hypothetical protein n=1 Tax=Clostridium sp. ZS2-4 TaxID=2987703 RepID=UPI00227A29E0|nr:hypothetical protein [Clostridium sp. ZS2-4]MCY6353826.1 hypothetical protein [Clostridium sp. ZS2-4]
MKSSKLSLKAKILCGVLAGGVVLSAGSSAFAVSENASDSTQNLKIEHRIPMNRDKFNKDKMEERNKIFESVLQEAVKSNTITQDESNKIKAYTDKKAEEAKQFMQERKKEGKKEDNKAPKDRKINKAGKIGKEGKGGLFAELVNEGILTQEKADILREKMQDKTKALRDARLKEELSKLVENKTLTQEQADKIAAAIKTANDARKADFEKIKDMTDEERREYMKGIKDSYKDPLKTLVENGTITEVQEKEVRKILHGYKNKHHAPRVKGKIPGNKLVKKNTKKQ